MKRAIHLLAVAALALGVAACSGEDDEKQCQDFCGEGAACVEGACVAVEPCDPACGAGTVCQTAGASAACVPLLSSACEGGCDAASVCVVSGGEAACVGVCGEGQAWDSAAQRCEATSAYCGPGQTWDAEALKCLVTNLHAAVLTGPYAKGEDVTADCLACHAQAAEEMLGSAHFRWSGPQPGLVDAAGEPVEAAGTIGKRNTINDFCVAVATNEGRCGECHAGYADPAQKKLAYQLPADPARVDCLICHADLATGYVKSQKNFGVAEVKPATGCDPACTGTQVCLALEAGPACVAPGSAEYAAKLGEVLVAAAGSVGKPGRDNCGKCHFYAGGGDNVKLGDLASSLAEPAGPEVDVHMGSANPDAPRDCADCHAGEGFAHDAMKGTGLSVSLVEEAKLACADCHGTPPGDIHSEDHLAAIACQTCHVPAFARQIATKTEWDWSFAGYKDCRYPGAPEALVAACDTNPASPGFGTAKVTIDGAQVVYSWQKGVFVNEKNVKPAYRWYDGTGFHLTTTGATAAFDPALGAADARIALSGPAALPGAAGAKITPFKRMTGRQAVMKDGSFVIVPHLFGPWSLWGTKPDPTTAGATIPVVPATSAEPTGAKYGGHATYAAFVEAVWNDVVSFGAANGGQLPALATAPAGAAVRDASGDVTLTVTAHGLAAGRYNVMTADAGFAPGIRAVEVVDADTLRWHEPALPAPAAAVTSTQPVKLFRALVRGADWEWSHTEMFLNVNHEVAPAAGAVSGCADCHSATAALPLCELYEGAGRKPWGCP